MATLKVIYKQDRIGQQIFGNSKYHDAKALDYLTSYCLNDDKTHGHTVGLGVSVTQAAMEMDKIARIYGKASGIRVRHWVLSFHPKETVEFKDYLFDELSRIGTYAAQYYCNAYQIFYAIHLKDENPHIHFVMNSVSYRDGSKYEGKKEDYYNYQRYLERFLSDYYGLHLKAVADS